MFDTCSTKELCALLDCFHVPMFAAQRAAPEHPFVLVCNNAAHETAAGLCGDRIKGAVLKDILPPDEADVVAEKFDICAKTRQDQRYFQTLTMPIGVVKWDTTLQHVPLKAGGDRIIGTALKIEEAHHSRALEDVWFCSSVADLQLQNLSALLDEARNAEMFCQHNAERVRKLAALCRSVQQAISDIRVLARPATQGQGEAPHRANIVTDVPGVELLRTLNTAACGEDSITLHNSNK